MKLINIAFDLDGVLVDIWSIVLDIIRERYDCKILPQTEWQLHTKPQISNELIWKCIFVAYQQKRTVEIYPGAQELLRKLFKLSDYNDPIRIITARPFMAANDTYEFFDARFSGFEYEIVFAPGLDKLKHLNRYDYMVEDRRRTTKHLANNGKTVFLLDRSYNQMTESSPWVRRIKNLEDLIPYADRFITIRQPLKVT